ncbi:MAG: hypothetical protein D6754_17195, partial [Alphaproteobacteria bacterium]
ALLIPYRTAAEAEDAVARFGPLLGTIRSFVVKKPLDDLLPGERQFDVLATAGAHVAVLAFAADLGDKAQGGGTPTPADLLGSAFHRLSQMRATMDLQLLIGR